MRQKTRRYLDIAAIIGLIVIAGVSGYITGLSRGPENEEADADEAEYFAGSFQADATYAGHLVELLRELRNGNHDRAIAMLEEDLHTTCITAYSSARANPEVLTKPWLLGAWSHVKAYRRDHPAPSPTGFDEPMKVEFWDRIPDVPPEVRAEEPNG